VLAAALAVTLSGCASTKPSAAAADATIAAVSSPAASEANKPSTDSAGPTLTSSPMLSTPSAAMRAAAVGQANSRVVAQLTPANDMWERIRRGFAMPDLDSDLVRNQEQWYASKPEYIGRMTERSRKYLFHIVEELERRNMPTELALLPFIESAFNPTAMSSAKASGIWQFMPSTGRHFELKQNVFRDDRRDVQASTRAALDYLQKLHRMFGDWHLAMAAYNWGEGSVGRAIAKNKAAGLGTAYTDLNMPRETQLYVPKLQAVKNIVANPQVFKASLPDIGNHPYFQSVQVSRDIDVALATKLAEIKLDDFKSLNPSANKPVILASGTPQILLPWDNAAVYEANLAAHKGQLASWTAWTAPSTLKVSEAAKRVGMSESELRSINNIPPKMLIKQGSTLLVPRSVRVEKDVPLHVADNGQVSLAPEVVLRKTSVRAGKSDSVASIAKRYALSVASVAQWNNVPASAGFRKGQSVVVYLPVKAKVVRRKRR
jgi:membrane-bound lytic murein transglycosylase D